jgi:2'-5' RNA ligase
MRVFLAIDLDGAARDAAAAWSRALSTRLGSAMAREIKWVEPANLHLTLHFFGELRDDQVDAVKRTLGAPFETQAFRLVLAGAGTFPPSGAARVVWLGVRDHGSDSSGDALQTIYRGVQARLETLGLQEQSARAFAPHLTIGRVRTPAGPLTRALREALAGTPAPSNAFVIAHLTLYQSRLSPKGPTYHPLERFPLSP